MDNFMFHLPTRVVFGPGTLRRLGEMAGDIGRRPLLVTGKSSSGETGILNRAMDYLEHAGLQPALFAQIEANPRVETVDRAVALARERKCDFVIGLGGGSPMDAAKVIALAAAEGYPAWEFIPHGGEVVRQATKALPLLMVPTLAATGSEVNGVAVITNWETHEKAVIGHRLLYPRVSIVDPELTVTVPRDYTIDGGIDIISHVIEGFFTGVESTPLQDRFSLAVVRTVMEYLPRVMENPNDINARSQLSWCSVVAMSGLVNPGRGDKWPLHALEHPLSGHYDISHGRGLALLLPRLMAFTIKARPQKFGFMARELFHLDEGDDMRLGQQAIDGVVDFLRSVDRFLVMSDVGIPDDSRFEAMADDTIRLYGTAEGCLANPRPLYKDDVVEIYSRCQSAVV
jgi:alcohol dehydrogenase YqhD (iron-dependent ADH family)